jgi:hypothetical protein
VTALPLNDQIRTDQDSFAGGIEVQHSAPRHHHLLTSGTRIQVYAITAGASPSLNYRQALQLRPFVSSQNQSIISLSNSTSASACPKTAEIVGLTVSLAFLTRSQTMQTPAEAL